MGQVAREPVKLIHPSDVPRVWPLVKHWLEEAATYSGGRFEADDFYQDLINFNADLYVNESMAMICAPTQYPRRLVYTALLIGGDGIVESIAECAEIVEKVAKYRKCDGVEAYGRAGWRKMAEGLGWSRSSVVFEKRL